MSFLSSRYFHYSQAYSFWSSFLSSFLYKSFLLHGWENSRLLHKFRQKGKERKEDLYWECLWSKKYSDHLFLVRAANIDPETLAYWVCCKKHNSGYRGEKLCVESSLLVKVCFRPTPHLQKRLEQGGQGPLNCIIAHFRRNSW